MLNQTSAEKSEVSRCYLSTGNASCTPGFDNTIAIIERHDRFEAMLTYLFEKFDLNDVVIASIVFLTHEEQEAFRPVMSNMLVEPLHSVSKRLMPSSGDEDNRSVCRKATAELDHMRDRKIVTAISKVGVPILGLLLDVVDPMLAVSERSVDVKNVAGCHQFLL